MGIKGLTKFINDRSDKYLENYELHDCNLIIDGNSLSCQLYNWNHWQFQTRSWSCYGGDYDKYAHTVDQFFQMLEEVNVVPYVIFDGGFEDRKFQTVLNRMQNKVDIAENLNPESEATQPNKVVFPIFLREVFQDVIRNRDIKLAMCEFEGDTEIASIAKTLQCPVLSLDSDYYLYGVEYIPFNMIESKIQNITNWRTGRYRYVPCKLFKIDNLLKDFDGLQKDSLYLIPVLLGNDYMEDTYLEIFLETLNLGKDVPLQDKIAAIFEWLKERTAEAAITKILESYQTRDEKLKILKKIKEIVVGYIHRDTELFDFFNIKTKSDEEECIDFENIQKEIYSSTQVEQNGLENNHNSDNSNSNSENNENFIVKQNGNIKNAKNKLFIKNFTKCQYPSFCMDIIARNTFLFRPQVENYANENSHMPSLDLLRAIHKILTRNLNKDEFEVVWRTNGNNIEKSTQSTSGIELPSINAIEQLTLIGRREVLFSILQLENSISKTFLAHFPTEWHLLLISLKYCFIKLKLETPLIYSLVLCFIILNYIDQKIGFYRSTKTLQAAYANPIFPQQPEYIKIDKNCFYYFPSADCVTCMNKIIHLFEVDPKEDSNTFDKDLVHSIAQIQSIFLLIKHLNSLLNFPYSNLLVHRIFDCTFIYNTTKVFTKMSKDCDNNYLNRFFQECPKILAGLKYAFNLLSKQIIL